MTVERKINWGENEKGKNTPIHRLKQKGEEKKKEKKKKDTNFKYDGLARNGFGLSRMCAIRTIAN